MTNLPWTQVLADFTPAAAPPGGLTGGPGTIALDVGDGRAVPRISTSRGRSYELAGSSQSGTCTIEVQDPQETLNPANTASPLMSGDNTLALYRSVGVRAYWPREGNWLAGTAAAVPEYHPGFEAGSDNGWISPDGTATNVSTAPWQGTRCLRLVLNGPSATVQAFPLGYFTLPGKRYTYSVYVRRDAAATGATVSVSAVGQTSASTSSTAWTRLAVTFTATAALTTVTMNVTGGPAGAGTQIVFVDAEQLELGEAATTWTPTGPIRYSLWTGYIERYPQTWMSNGRWGVRPLECVDSLSVLSRTIVRESYDSEITLDEAALYVPLDDAAGPGMVRGRLSGTVSIFERVADKGGAVAWQADTQPDGTRAVTLTQQLQNPADVPRAEQATSLETRPPAGPSPSKFTLDTRSATIEFWVRQAAALGRVQFASVKNGDFVNAFGPNDESVNLEYFGNGEVVLDVLNRGSRSIATVFGGAPDDQWHYYCITFRTSASLPGTGFDVEFRHDGFVETLTNAGPIRTFAINSIRVTAETMDADPVCKISAARLAFYPYALSTVRQEAHFRRGIGYRGETAEARATRLLSKYWAGNFVVQPGSGLTLPGDHGYSGASVLAALEDVATADEGQVYSSRTGEPVVESRLTRAATTTSTFTFGEAPGEVPYTSLDYDFDPGNVYSTISLSRPGGGEPVEVTDPTVEALVGQRVLSRTISVDSDFELREAAKYYSQRYGQARLRVRSMRLEPGANPSIWPIVLALDVSQRATVNRRTAHGTIISADYFVESIKNDIDVEVSSWSVTLEMSPVFVPQGWVLGSTSLGVLGSTTIPVY